MTRQNDNLSSPIQKRALALRKGLGGAHYSAARAKAHMKVYQFNFPEEVISRFRNYCKARGLSLAGGVRLVVLEYMEEHDL